ncbi:sensor histidine kinase [Edaphobacillus lindanitolerans]|uniref:histidine kinase n=1 Tax=Edaphobacillus lindanitolerans TaxID=550447 RepID=A0A1U7PNF3_9BACI|nr:sensor histidine kinase [Edaphobacillus lindanitolerans]SIT72529.1 two-component system, CitB family, sensor histidine kinase CitS [Edaphobacillus lindanitolerans]
MKKKRKKRVPIGVKILGLVISLIVIIVITITGVFIVMSFKKDQEKAGNIAHQTARSLSYMPIAQDAFYQNEKIEDLKNIVDNLLEDIEASAIVVTYHNRFFIVRGNPDTIIQLMDDPANEKALIFGSNYVKTIGDKKNKVLVGVSPIFVEHGEYKQLEGTIMVAYDQKQILKDVMSESITLLIVSSIVLLAGLFGSIMLAKDIKKDTLGLEPGEIADLYHERKAVFMSIKDGLIVVDQTGVINMINRSAKHLLNIKGDVKGLHLAQLFDGADTIWKLSNSDVSKEFEYCGKVMLISRQEVRRHNQVKGMIISLYDKTEIRKMARSLSEERHYIEDLRAQAHEFKNKMYVISGLIQLGKTREAVQFLMEETSSLEDQNKFISESIKDEKVQAIILGKKAKASEQHVTFNVHPESALGILPPHISLNALVTALGNLIDNAIEAVKGQDETNVSLFFTDVGNDIIFEVSDNGPGVREEEGSVFKKGFSTKGEGRGYGLWNVMMEVNRLSGEIEMQSNTKGTTFTIFIPKHP